jgi:5'-nucleotidase
MEFVMKKISFVALGLSIVTTVLLGSAVEVTTVSTVNILLSNDDGIDAPSLAVLAEKLSSIAKVTVAAPTQDYGGFGHAMTFLEPILVSESKKNGVMWYAIKATPPSCVRLAVEALMTQKPDFVVAGINTGENTGIDVYYSATVACAREAAFLGIPGISVNLGTGPSKDFDPTADFIVALVQALIKKPIKPGTYINVNVPGLLKEEIKGVMVAPHDVRPTLEFFEKRVNPRGRTYYWNSFKDLEAGSQKTDVWAVRNGYIAVTPLQIDQTNYPELKNLESLEIAGWKK